MNTTHQSGNVMALEFSRQKGYLFNVPQQMIHTLIVPKISSPLLVGVGKRRSLAKIVETMCDKK